MSKTYYGLIEPNPEKLNETIKVVSVEISDERGRAVKEYDLEPANRYIGIPFFHGYAWGYGGEGPKALAEAILFDYTGDVKNIRKYRNALITCEIQHFDHDKGFILDSDHIEAAMRFADRQQEELEREDRRQQRRFLFSRWRHHPWLAMGALGRWAKDAYSEHEYLTWFIGVVVGLLGIILALV